MGGIPVQGVVGEHEPADLLPGRDLGRRVFLHLQQRLPGQVQLELVADRAGRVLDRQVRGRNRTQVNGATDKGDAIIVKNDGLSRCTLSATPTTDLFVAPPFLPNAGLVFWISAPMVGSNETR